MADFTALGWRVAIGCPSPVVWRPQADLLRFHSHILPRRVGEWLELASARPPGGDFRPSLGGQPVQPVLPPRARRLLGCGDPGVELTRGRTVRPELIFGLAGRVDDAGD